MSIYATLWQLRFPRTGDAYERCEWVDVFAQGVPAHIGTPTPGYGYEAGDPYHAFLPPALRIGVDASPLLRHPNYSLQLSYIRQEYSRIRGAEQHRLQFTR